MIQKPKIGITLDSVDPDFHSEGNWYSKLPWYALRQRYCDAIAEAGGIPIPLPHNTDLISEFSSLIDGLVISGGGFDIDPALYGATETHPTVTINPRRTAFEWQLAQEFYNTNKPILGICGGMQLLNVMMGGTLIQHIPDEVPNSLNHRQEKPRTEAGHTITIKEETLFHRIIGDIAREDVPVNTVHHQAIRDIAGGLIINALAPDGIIEGIEAINHPFCLGVQWHPEFHVNSVDTALLNGFICASCH